MWFGVTDLVNPARKYYEVKFPNIPEDAEVIEKFRHGNNVHDMMFSWIRHFAPMAVREEEVNGEMDGLPQVRGRIDFRIDNHIIEFKTTSHDINSESDVLKKNPQDLEQLVFYATLSGRIHEEHYLIYYEQDHQELFRAFTVKIRPGADPISFVRNRLDALVTSIQNSDQENLGRCRYFEYGCKFTTNEICSCSTFSPIDQSFLDREVVIQRNLELEAKLEDGRLNSSVYAYGSFSLWDLLIPRRTYLERKGLLDTAEEAEQLNPDETLISINNAVYDSGIYRERREIRINDRSLGYVPMVSLPAVPDGGDQYERIYPILARSYGYEPDKLSTSKLSPFYILRMAMICSLSGSNTGYILVGFRNDSSRAKCFRVRFRDLPLIRDKILERIEEIEYSISSDKTEHLPQCPSFVQNNCGTACLCRPSYGS
jgi:hypothetical protein